MGQRDGFGSNDIRRINAMYDCGNVRPSSAGSEIGKPIGTNKPNKRPRPSSAGGASPIQPIKPIKPIKPIRPGRPGGLNSNNRVGQNNGLVDKFLGGLSQIGQGMAGAFGFNEEENLDEEN